MNSPPLLVIAGPTATGKTGLAIRTALALRAGGVPTEIISADSRQVYRGLDIGTAKVTVADRGGIRHHGLDLVDPDEPFSVADFIRHARQALDGIGRERGIAVLAGGTGLYLRAIARGLDPDALPSDPDRRREIDAAIEADGLASAAERLVAIAPTRAARVDLRNPRRVSRALELAELSGDARLPAPIAYPGPIAWIGLDVDPTIHGEWIANRAREQFASGLIEEARALREHYDPALPPFSAIGYREAWGVLDGDLTREQGIEVDAARNVAFAKRQRTWFRREPEVVWLDASSPDVDAVAAAAARRLLEGGTAEIAR